MFVVCPRQAAVAGMQGIRKLRLHHCHLSGPRMVGLGIILAKLPNLVVRLPPDMFAHKICFKCADNFSYPQHL